MSLLLLLWPLWLTRRPEADSPLWARRSLILLISLLTLRYLHWRCTDSLNLDSGLSTALSLLMLVAEGWLLVTGLLPLWLAWRAFPDRRTQVADLTHRWKADRWQPKVAILVPSYGEPLNVLERTLQGCLAQSYPQCTVWLLDDSGRDDVRQLARKLGCRYRHRPQRSNAKAGNLNDGLRRIEAELVAVFDADFIPQTVFLERCIGFLQDPEVALVQTPQSFLNADPVMRNLGMEPWLLPDEESFYRWIEPVRDGWGAVVCAGTSFVVRRAALDQVGGFVEQALSEDFVTGIALRQQGWRLVYLQEKLSAGLAAETMADFVHQRQRWAAGTLQSLRLSNGPIRAGGLSLGQRLAYLEGVIHWINNLPRLVLMLMPLSYGLLNILPIHLTGRAILELVLPMWATVLLSIGWLNRGSRAALLSELTGWVLTVPLTSTLISTALGRRLGFRVTPKHQSRGQGGWSWFLALPLLVLTALNAANLAGLLQQLGNGEAWGDDGRFAGLAWAVLNLLGTLTALRACWDPPMRDPAPWLAVDMEGEVLDAGGHRHPCRIKAISETGAELHFRNHVPPLVSSSALRWSTAVPPLPIEISAERPLARAVAWGKTTARQQHALMQWLYGRSGCWRDRLAPQEWRALLALLKRVLFGTPAPAAFRRSLVPLAAQGSTSGQL